MSVPAREIEGRVKKLRAAMGRRRLGAVVVSQPDDVHYFSGFEGDDSLLVITRSRLWIVTDGRYAEAAGEGLPGFDVHLWKGNRERAAGELVRKAGCKRLGCCERHLSVAAHRQLRKGARGVRAEACDDMLAGLRSIKSNWEVRAIQKALRCAEAALRAVLPAIETGQPEMHIRRALEDEMRSRGAEATAFETIVAAGPNASRPHAHAGKRRLRGGQPLLIDFGARLGRYNSDLTRVFFAGSISRFWRDRYEAVREAQAAGIAAIRPGARCAEADAAARNVFAAAGWEKAFCHGLGHGVGLAVHEGPRLSRGCETELAPGMIVTVEPGLYFPGRGGIRIEDMVLVTESGARRLSRLPRSLDDASLERYRGRGGGRG